jgi:putative ABC transport system permease protein
MSLEDMKAFGIDISEVEGVKYKVDSVKWNCEADELANKEESKCIIPIAVDSEALLWSMMKKVGDTLSYHASDGRKVNVVIAAEYPTGIFHGNAIMPIDCFRQLWPDEMGSRVILVKEEGQMAKGESQKALTSNPSPSNLPLSGGIEGVSQLSTLTTALSDYGFTLIPSVERLLHFFEVTDTYLRIFLSLGVLGLLLGLVSLIIVIRKNLVARSEEIRLYHALGFPTATIVRMFRCEQLIVPLLAILTGAVACLLISVLLPTFSFSLSTFLLWLLPIIVFTCIIIYISITTKTIRQCETC